MLATCILISTILLSKYLSNLRCNNIKTIGKSRVTWVLHRPFKIKDSFVLRGKDGNGIGLTPKFTKNRYLVEESDDIENIEQVKSTVHDINGGFTTSIVDVEGVTKHTLVKYLGKRGLVNNVYMEELSNVGSDSRLTLENEIKNNTLICILILDCVILMSIAFGHPDSFYL